MSCISSVINTFAIITVTCLHTEVFVRQGSEILNTQGTTVVFLTPSRLGVFNHPRFSNLSKKNCHSKIVVCERFAQLRV